MLADAAADALLRVHVGLLEADLDRHRAAGRGGLGSGQGPFKLKCPGRVGGDPDPAAVGHERIVIPGGEAARVERIGGECHAAAVGAFHGQRGARPHGAEDLAREDGLGADRAYSNTLFNYKNEFLQHIAEGIELGRSFVRPEYQKLYLPLLLLWKGIARFMVRNPSYTTLFGLVSVSDAYSSLSRQLIVSYLTMNHYAPELARFVKPKKSAGRGLSKKHRFHCPSSMPSNIDELSSLIADIENDRKGIPVLLKQYVKLGGKLMSFCLDPSFGNVLDGLILVDLLKCDRRIMTRFMGPEGADHYFRYHQELSLQNMAS